MTKSTKAETANTEAKQVAPKAPKDEKNGVVRPKAGTSTGRVWEVADKLSGEYQRPATRAEVMEVCSGEGLNPSTIATQYGKWRKYHDLVGANSPKAPAKEEAPAETKVADETEAAADTGGIESTGETNSEEV